MNSQVAQRFQSFGTTLMIMGAMLTFLSIVGLPFSIVYAFANSMSEMMKHVPTSFGTIFFNILPLYLIGTVIVSIYFIVVGAKMSAEKYTPKQLKGVLIRVTIGSIFWPVVGLITMIMAIIARQDWLLEYENSSLQEPVVNQENNVSQGHIGSRDEMFSLSSQPQIVSPPSVFPKIKVFGILMAALNILNAITIVASFVITLVINNPTVINNISSALLSLYSEATGSTRTYSVEYIILNNLPQLIFGAIMLLLHIYAAYLGFTLKRYKNDFKKLKVQLIVLAIISVLSNLWLLAIIGDIICFSSLLPEYERELKSRLESKTPVK